LSKFAFLEHVGVAIWKV